MVAAMLDCHFFAAVDSDSGKSMPIPSQLCSWAGRQLSDELDFVLIWAQKV